MADFQQFTSLLAQVPPVLKPLAIDVSEEQQCCFILMEPDLGVLIQLDGARNRFFLSSELGAPPPCDLKRLYENLLYVNYHWEKTGGARLALNRPDGEVVLVAEAAAEGADVTQFCAAITAFVRMAQGCRKVIQNPAAAEKSAPETSFIPSMRV